MCRFDAKLAVRSRRALNSHTVRDVTCDVTLTLQPTVPCDVCNHNFYNETAF